MKKTQSIAILSCLALAAMLALGAMAQSVPSLINYQGKLTDAAGQFLTNGTYSVAFRIWSHKSSIDPSFFVWGQEYTSIPVIDGHFNVMLGNGRPITDPTPTVTNISSAFGAPDRFLGITVTKGANGITNSIATEIIPRQQVLTTPFAFVADRASSAEFAKTADILTTSPIPRGVIVLWSGATTNIPPGWSFCNGANGTPDLRDRFVIGAKIDVNTIAMSHIEGSLNQSGGSTTQPPTTQATASGSVGQFEGNGKDIVLTGHTHPFVPPYYALAFIMKL